ncbi:MAG TPA: alpha/beta fold hydrolase [Candidatus Polarisedimenticolia bacterium]|nr:alpha/beta fold hydrolase [Candidatus Polarisedimenticolia bacterium]
MIPVLLTLALAAPVAATPRAAATAPASGLVERSVHVPFAGSATLYVPPVRPSRAILFLSGDGGWNLGVVEMARRAARESGAVVAGLSLPAYLKAASREKVPCWCPACDLEEIGKAVEKQAGFEEPSPPILLGYSSGATLVYAALAGGPPETFAGGMSLGFCPDLEGVPPICRHAGWRPTYDAAKLRLDVPPVGLERPWVVLQGNADQVCAAAATDRFVRAVEGATIARLDGVGHGYGNEKRWGAAFDAGLKTLMASSASPTPAGENPVAAGAATPESATVLEAALDRLDLPLVNRLTERPRAFLVFLSGDGGWSSLDRALANRLVRDHVDTIGISALQYFWKEKPAALVAADLRRILDLLRASGKPVLLGGYSFGAEVAPFLVNRSEPSFAGLVLVAPGPYATWEVSALDWLRQKEKPSPDRVRPRIESLGEDLPTLCIYGAEDRESACSGLASTSGRLVRALGGGHHFGGDYDVIADAVAGFVEKTIAAGVLTSASDPTPDR